MPFCYPKLRGFRRKTDNDVDEFDNCKHHGRLQELLTAHPIIIRFYVYFPQLSPTSIERQGYYLLNSSTVPISKPISGTFYYICFCGFQENQRREKLSINSTLIPLRSKNSPFLAKNDAKNKTIIKLYLNILTHNINVP